MWLGTHAAAFSWFQSKTFSERDPTWRDRQEDCSKAACEIYCGDATALRIRMLSFLDELSRWLVLYIDGYLVPIVCYPCAHVKHIVPGMLRLQT